MADRIGVIGAGAFGTALAVAQAAAGRQVALWARDADAVASMVARRENRTRLPGVGLPSGLTPIADFNVAAEAPVLLLTVPTQQLRSVLEDHAETLAGRTLVACCKGVELGTGFLPAEVIADAIPSARADDIPQSVNYVREALQAMGKGATVPNPVTRAYGCAVHYSS